MAALDVRNFAPTRLLFILHRESILVKAMETFKAVFGSIYSYGLFTRNEKNIEADMIFATNITLANNLDIFDNDDFDYIILDECHRICRSECYGVC